jgi:hypothetical protein
MSLPIDNINTTQVDTMERELKFDADVFLLVMFKKINQWYRLDYEYLKKIMCDNDCGYASIPLQYFRAFGHLVPNDDGIPDFLCIERHPEQKTLVETYPSWMAGHERHKREVLEIKPYRDENERKSRIKEAVIAGIKKAQIKSQQIKIWGSHEPQRRDFDEN